MRRRVAAVFIVGVMVCLLVPQPSVNAATDETGVAPTWIWIPAIGVEAEIEAVAITDGQMGVPTDPWNVGWYPDLGYLDDGSNVVMAGHVDWWGYGPTVFADLADLGENDTIVVGGDTGASYVYAVTAIWTVDDTSAAKDVWDIFHGSNDDAHMLTLITCTGDFDGTAYDGRLIVRAELVKTVPPSS